MKRETKTILIVLFSGILLVGGLFAYEFLAEEEIKSELAEETVTDSESSIHKQLEKKIDGLKNSAFNPQSYSILMTEIHAYYMMESFTQSIKTSLENRLLDVYSQQVYAEAEKFLTGRTSNSNEVQSLLAQIKLNGGNSSKINYYERQIRYFNYYSTSLPQKVSAFIRKGITNYTEEEYNQYKAEVSNMPNLDEKYKSVKFHKIKTDLIHNLEEFTLAYNIPTYKPEYQNL